MKDIGIRDSLFNHFKTLNTFSGITFLTSDNVKYPNEKFKEPENKRWFEVHFLPDAPSGIAMGFNELERYRGVLQIDVVTPFDSGESEADTKFQWIAKLFAVGTSIGDVLVDKVYKAKTVEEGKCYRTIVRIEFDADVDNSL